MFKHLIVPIDGSKESWNAVPIAARMANEVCGTVTAVTVVDRLGDVTGARTELERGVDRLGDLPVAPEVDVLASDSVVKALADLIEALPGSTVVMSSHGHGRSAAVLGSTADALLRRIFGPIVVVGPDAQSSMGEVAGTYLVPVDGSQLGETILPIAEAWAVEFGGVPWVVEVVEPALDLNADFFESGYPARLAAKVRERIGKPVEFDVLHHEHPARGIVEFAERMSCSVIFMSTHGRTGMERFRAGSVTSQVVRHAPCPVVLYRPPQLAT